MTIQKSAEDYLEAMLMLKEERGYIRSIDVAEKLGVTKPSVSYATKRLRESGYISFDSAGMIVLCLIFPRMDSGVNSDNRTGPMMPRLFRRGII